MDALLQSIADLLWRGALSTIPLVVMVAIACRWLASRHTTRHMLWFVVLVCFLAAPLLPTSPASGRFISTVSQWRKAIANSWQQRSAQGMDRALIAAKSAEHQRQWTDGASSRSDARSPHAAVRDEKPTNRRSAARYRAGGSEGQPAWLAQVDSSDGPPSPLPARSKEASSGHSMCRDHNQLAAETQESARSSPTKQVVRRLPNKRTVNERPLPRVKAAVPDQTVTRTERIAKANRNTPHARQVGQAPATEAPIDQTERPVTEPAKLAASLDDSMQERRWLIAWADLRSLLSSLPSVPPHIWLCGFGLFALCKIVGMVRLRRLLRSSFGAGEETVRLVRETASQIGLARVPSVRMLDEAVTPMVMAGRGSCLVLPCSLWGELDETGRRAVVCHELAHLKRRDHWIYWFQLLVGAVYWWNPLVHWARTRLVAEAEFCCDAWVTWLMPRERRAYAEALIRAKQFVAAAGSPPADGAVGMMSGRARRFARRLKMVMTERVVPRQSISGLALVTAVALAGWLATPVFSCPSEKKASGCSKKSKSVAKTVSGSTVGKDCCSSSMKCTKCTKRSKACCGGCAKSNCGRCSKKGKSKGLAKGKPALKQYSVDLPSYDAPAVVLTGSGNSDKRIRKLEERLEKLSRQMEVLVDRLEDRGDRDERRSRQARESRSARSARQARPARPARPAPSARSIDPPMGFGPGDGGSTLTVHYPLADGKREALRALMVRSDVPIYVRPAPDGIQVIGTPAQQSVFRSFVTTLNKSETHKVTYALTDGKLDALVKLMARSDVPTLISTGDGGITVHGDAGVQAAVAGFVEMIGGGEHRQAGAWQEAGGSRFSSVRNARESEIEAMMEAQEAAREQFEEAQAEARAELEEALMEAREAQVEAAEEARAEFEEAQLEVKAAKEAHAKAQKELRRQKKQMQKQYEAAKKKEQKMRKSHEQKQHKLKKKHKKVKPDSDLDANAAKGSGVAKIAGVDVAEFFGMASDVVTSDAAVELFEAAKTYAIKSAQQP